MAGRNRATELREGVPKAVDGEFDRSSAARRSWIDGRLEAVLDGRAVGWAWCPDEPSRRLEVTILVDGEEVASGHADLIRSSLAEAGIGDGAHVFDVPLPRYLADGGAHTVEAVGGLEQWPLPPAGGFSAGVADAREFAGTTFVPALAVGSAPDDRPDATEGATASPASLALIEDTPDGQAPPTAPAGEPVSATDSNWGWRFSATAAPVAVVAACSLCVLLLSGVTPAQVLTFVGYEGFLVVGPGLLACRLLLPGVSGWLPRIVLAWSLGYVLEIGAWIVVSLLGARELIWAYPAIILAGTVASARRPVRTPPATVAAHGVAWRWAMALTAICAVASVAATGFQHQPLPDRTHGVTWGNTAYDLSIAALAKHEWPITDPTVSGVDLPYHTFMHIDVAATSSATGIPTAVVMYRINPVLQILLLVLGLSAAAARLTGRPWAGPLCAALFLFIGEANLDPASGTAWGNELAYDLFDVSPSFLFGLVIFTPTLILLHENLETLRRDGTRGRWLALTILLIGCFGAKSATGPVLVGGLLLYVVWRRLRERQWSAPGVTALGLSLAAWLAFYVAVYAAAGTAGLMLDVPGTMRDMSYISAALPSVVSNQGLIATVGLSIAVPIVLVAAYGATLVGLPWSVGRAAGPAASLLVAIAVPGLGLYLLFESPSVSQIYFFEYSLVGLTILGAAGLCRLGGTFTRSWAVKVAAPFATCWLLFLAGVVVLSRSAIGDGEDGSSVRRRIAVLAAIAVPIGVIAWVGRRRSRRSLIGVAAMAVVGVGAVTFPLHVIANLFIPPFNAAPTGEPDMTAEVFTGLNWVRTHTPGDAVIAVSNRDTRGLGPDFNYYYSAFSERSVFVEGRHWAFDTYGGQGSPFAYRVRLSNAVFARADPRALAVMVHRWHVGYLFVDRTYSPVSPLLGEIAALVYSNRDVAIYATRAAGGSRERHSTTWSKI